MTQRQREALKPAPRLRRRHDAPEVLDVCAKRIEALTGVGKEAIISDLRYPKVCEARKLFCYFATDIEAICIADIADYIKRTNSNVGQLIDCIAYEPIEVYKLENDAYHRMKAADAVKLVEKGVVHV
jgi:hypothetical protein